MFDLLRGLSAMVVLVAHALQIFTGPNELASVAARHAVLIFFLLSGRLITQSIQANAQRNGAFKPLPYLISRVARIYPPLLGAIAVTALCCIANTGRLTLSASDIPLALLMHNGLLNANGPLWSLYIEWHLYLIAGLVATRNLFYALLACVLAVLCLRAFPAFLFFASVWCLGALRIRLWPAALVAVVAIAVIEPSAALINESWQSYAFQGIACVAWLGLFEIKTEIRLTECSYSLYVLHFPLLLLAFIISPTPTAAVIACLGIVAVSALFARLFERQHYFAALIRRLIDRSGHAVGKVNRHRV